MGTTGLGEGHEKTGTGATWQSDGLRDTDVLSTATLTNFVERGLYNGIVPITLTNYSNDSGGSDRNNPISGNCAVRKNTGGASNSLFVDSGVVLLDGVYYNVGNTAGAFNINTAGHYNARFNAGGMALPSAANEECWVLVIVDPELAGTNNVGLVGGTIVDTSTGLYPQMPSSHLIKQSLILGAIRVTNGNIVAAVEDKRVFIRGGPLPLTKLIDQAGNGSNVVNDYGHTPTVAGNLPIAGIGNVFSRDPVGYNASLGAGVHGAGQTHLFYQADIATSAVPGGSYQLTPVHRQARETLPYAGAGPCPVPLTFTPLVVQNPGGFGATEHLMTAMWLSAAGDAYPLHEGIHYTLAVKVITFLNLTAVANQVVGGGGGLGAGNVIFYYTHSGF